MSAGLPGLGLGGLFFLLSALFVAPGVEIVRTVRGQSSVEAWRVVARQFAMALVMVGAIEATLRATALFPGDAFQEAGKGLAGPAFEPIAFAMVGLGAMLLVVKLIALALRPRKPRRRDPVTDRVYRLGRRLVFDRGGS